MAKVLRLCDSSEHEAASAIMAGRRILAEADMRFIDLADHVELMLYPIEEMQKAYHYGLEEGRGQGGGGPISAEFLDDRAQPRWFAMASFLEKNPAGLDSKAQTFVEDMAVRLRHSTPSRNQGAWLLSLFWKARGSFI
jgi:hypothetical protein